MEWKTRLVEEKDSVEALQGGGEEDVEEGHHRHGHRHGHGQDVLVQQVIHKNQNQTQNQTKEVKKNGIRVCGHALA